MTLPDRDGKSTASSAFHASHYPEPRELQEKDIEELWHYSRDEIAKRAHELWRQRGCPQGSAEQDWFDAEEELRARQNSERTRRFDGDLSGSVQA